MGPLRSSPRRFHIDHGRATNVDMTQVAARVSPVSGCGRSRALRRPPSPSPDSLSLVTALPARPSASQLLLTPVLHNPAGNTPRGTPFASPAQSSHGRLSWPSSPVAQFAADLKKRSAEEMPRAASPATRPRRASHSLSRLATPTGHWVLQPRHARVRRGRVSSRGHTHSCSAENSADEPIAWNRTPRAARVASPAGAVRS